MMFPNKKMAWIITTRRGLSPRWKPGISGYRGVVVVIEPQAQVIYQGVQQDDFTAANHARVSQSQGDDIQTRLGLHSEWRTAVHVTPTLDLNYYHDPHSTEIEERWQHYQ